MVCMYFILTDTVHVEVNTKMSFEKQSLDVASFSKCARFELNAIFCSELVTATSIDEFIVFISFFVLNTDLMKSKC